MCTPVPVPSVLLCPGGVAGAAGCTSLLAAGSGPPGGARPPAPPPSPQICLHRSCRNRGAGGTCWVPSPQTPPCTCLGCSFPRGMRRLSGECGVRVTTREDVAETPACGDEEPASGWGPGKKRRAGLRAILGRPGDKEVNSLSWCRAWGCWRPRRLVSLTGLQTGSGGPIRPQKRPVCPPRVGPTAPVLSYLKLNSGLPSNGWARGETGAASHVAPTSVLGLTAEPAGGWDAGAAPPAQCPVAVICGHRPGRPSHRLGTD